MRLVSITYSTSRTTERIFLPYFGIVTWLEWACFKRLNVALKFEHTLAKEI